MADLEKVLGKTGAEKFWNKVWGNVKILTGDVAYKTKGDLQTQVTAAAMAAATAKSTADAAKAAASTAQNQAGNFGTAFSTTKAYAVGDYVIYGNKLYKFTTAHPAGDWNASHVTETTVAAELATQNKNFGGVSFGIDGDGNYGYYGADGSLIPFKKGECQLVSIGTIGGNGSFSVPTKYQANGIIAIPTTVTITTNSYGNCRLTQTFNGTSPAWSYNKDTGVVTTANSYWVICNDSGSIIYGGIAWTVYAVIVK